MANAIGDWASNPTYVINIVSMVAFTGFGILKWNEYHTIKIVCCAGCATAGSIGYMFA